MPKRYLFFAFVQLSILTSLSGQCPGSDVLWKRLLYLRDTSDLPLPVQLKELLRYDSLMTGCPYREDSTGAFLLQRIGALYFRTGNFAASTHALRRSITLIRRREDNSGSSLRLLPINYFILSRCYDSLGQVRLKVGAMDSGVYTALKYGSVNEVTLDLLLGLSKYFFRSGDYLRCLDYTVQGEALTRQHFTGRRQDSLAFTFSFLNWRANALIALKQYDAAKALVTGRIVMAERLRLTDRLAAMYSFLGRITREEGDYKKALGYFQKDLQYAIKAGFSQGCTEALNNTGYLYYSCLKKYDPALQYYRRALRFADGTDSMTIYDNIANVFVRTGRFDSAFFFFKQAFEKLGPGMDEGKLLQAPVEESIANMAEYVAELVLDKGQALLMRYKATNDRTFVKQAIQVYAKGDRLFEKLRTAQTELSSQLAWRKRVHQLYDQAIAAAEADGDAGNAFYFLERSRAALLHDQLNEQRWLNNEDILSLSQLKRRVLQLERDSQENNSAANTSLFISRQDLGRLRQSIKENNPLYYRSVLDTTFIGLKEMQVRLKEDKRSFVELYAGDSITYWLVITGSSVRLGHLKKAAFDSLVNTYISYISDADRLNRNMPGFIQTAFHLYRTIFPEDPAPGTQLIVSPDGNYFPFESFVTTQNIKAPGYLLYHHPILYTYSARYLLHSFEDNRQSSARDFAGIAPVHYDLSLHLPDLPGSDGSLRKIGAYFSEPDTFTSGQATRQKFLQNFSNHRIIQLYTHAMADLSGKEPYICFADSVLSLSELIPDGKPATRLIILSACETGNGKFYQGEGVFSFNRGFAALGIPSAIANLWSVDNNATYRIMELFYRHLSEGDASDIALQKAKQEFLQTATGEERLPYYWAAPILTGRSAVMMSKHPSKGWLFLAIPALLLVLVGWLSMFAIHRRKELRSRGRFTP